jgi:hypothetical protein
MAVFMSIVTAVFMSVVMAVFMLVFVADHGQRIFIGNKSSKKVG